MPPIKDKRLWTLIRSEFPCLVPALAIALGELLYFGYWWSVIFILLIFYLSWKNVLLILPGIVAAYGTVSHTSDFQFGNYYLLGVVDDVPRFFRQEEVNFSFRIVSAYRTYQAKNDKSKIIKAEVDLSNETAWCSAVYLPWRNIYGVNQGDLLSMRVTLLPFPEKMRASYQRKGYLAKCKVQYVNIENKVALPFFQNVKLILANKVRKVLGDSEESALFLAASIGYRDLISSVIEDAFKKTGLAHLLVLSGYQITLMYYFLLVVFKFLFSIFPFGKYSVVFHQIPLWLALIGTCLFIGLAGIEGPSLRAGFAALVVALASSFERSIGMLNSIIIAFLGLEIVWPASFLEPGVQLTFAALLGLCAALQTRKSDTLLMAYFKSCFYASFFTAPVILFWFNYLSLIGFLCNPIFAPLISILGCKIGFFALVCHLLGLDAEGQLLKFTGEALIKNSEVIRYLADFPFSGIEFDGGLLYCSICVSFVPIFIIIKIVMKIYFSQINLR